MKKFLYLLVIGTLLSSCGGSSSGGGGETPPPPVNHAPSTPSLVYPTNNLLCIDNVVSFQWNASTDSDGDAITYQVEVATDAGFSQIVHSVNSSTTSVSITLDKGVAYYWRVKATDSDSASSSYTAANQFYTEGTGVSNYLPFTPTLVGPSLNAVVQTATATLEWTSSDVDGDPLTYDVYFDTVNPPVTIVSTGQSGTTYTVNVSALTNYYWKVVVKDGQSGQSEGQVWNFSTD